jgi:hypothetical protein
MLVNHVGNGFLKFKRTPNIESFDLNKQVPISYEWIMPM